MATSRRSLRCRQAWQVAFLEILPVIESYARPAFRYLCAADREDAIQEAVAQAFLAFVMLMRRGRPDQIFATVLARYAIVRVRQGRKLGTRQNSRDVFSRLAQRRRGFRVERFDNSPVDDESWRAALVEDLRTPVPEQAAFRIDYPVWLSRLSSRDRRIAELLATGHSTQVVARKFGISPGRISQLRREFHESWEQFHEGLAGVENRNHPHPRAAARHCS